MVSESESENHSVMSDSLQPHGLYSPWNFLGQNTGVSSLFPVQGDLPNPGIEPRSPALQVDSSPAEPLGKPKNTEVGSLSLLQGILLTQESNWGLPQCRQIHYQLSYQGSPGSKEYRLQNWIRLKKKKKKNYEKQRNYELFPKSKTWICCSTLATINITFILYLQLLT